MRSPANTVETEGIDAIVKFLAGFQIEIMALICIRILSEY